jgi:hypothetical protein
MDAELDRILCELFVEALAYAGVMLAAYWVVSTLWKRRRS